jgi:hypothetical protein
MNNVRTWTLLFLTVFITPTFAYSNGMNRGDGFSHMWGAGMIYGPLMMIVSVAIVAIVVILVFRWLNGTGPMPPE